MQTGTSQLQLGEAAGWRSEGSQPNVSCEYGAMMVTAGTGVASLGSAEMALTDTQNPQDFWADAPALFEEVDALGNALATSLN